MGGLVCGALIVALIGYCRKPLPFSDSRWISGLVDRVTPPGAIVVVVPERSYDGFNVQALWELETPQDSQAYSRWVDSRLRVDSWTAGPAQDSKLVYKKALPGDSLSLILEQLSPGPPLRIRATFTSLPN